MSSGWIGVDLDGTLAHYDGWKGIEHIGPPVPAMLERVLAWIAEGREVRIFTARVTGTPTDPSGDNARSFIATWLRSHDLPFLRITNEKDFGMVELWDDRAVQVEANTGLAYVHPHGKPTP